MDITYVSLTIEHKKPQQKECDLSSNKFINVDNTQGETNNNRRKHDNDDMKSQDIKYEERADYNVPMDFQEQKHNLTKVTNNHNHKEKETVSEQTHKMSTDRFFIQNKQYHD